jgi:integrase
MGNLTAAEVKRLSEPGRYGDGEGLWLQVSKWKTKSWVLRYWVDGKERQFGLGPISLVSLADARERAREARRKLLDNIDPIQHRREQRTARRLEEAKAMTFGQCVDAYIKAHTAEWTNPIHAKQWQSTLTDDYCKPVLNLPVKNIDTDLVLKVITPQWNKRTVTAKRVLGRIERVLAWATSHGLRTGDNPARWRGHLKETLAAPTKIAPVKNHPALPYNDLPGFLEELRGRRAITARAMEFAILTAARTGEVIGARWNEIDVDGKLWVIPAERMKAGKEHRVPLSDQAIKLLKDLPRERGNPFVFPGSKPKSGLMVTAMLQMLRVMRPGITVHGFRSSFRDWCRERTNYPREIVELALAHVNKDKTEAAYARGAAVEKRRKLMQAWGGYCDSKPRTVADNVVKLRG